MPILVNYIEMALITLTAGAETRQTRSGAVSNLGAEKFSHCLHISGTCLNGGSCGHGWWVDGPIRWS